MSLNKDGLEIGKPVDFETLMRIKRKKPEVKEDAGQAKKPKQRKKSSKGE